MKNVLLSVIAIASPIVALAFTVVTVVPSRSIFYDISQIASQWLVVIGLPVGAAISIWGGVRYLMGRKDEEKKRSAKKKIVSGIVVIVFTLLAFALVFILTAPSGNF